MSSTDGRNIVLHVWTFPNIQISMLSDSDITEVNKLVAIAKEYANQHLTEQDC